MNNLEVLVTRRLPFSALNILKQKFDVDLWDSDDVIPRDVLLKKVKGKSGLLCMLTDKIDNEVLDCAGGGLLVVSTMSVGVDHIMLNECKNRNIKIGYTPNILSSATAELAVGLLLATSRRIVEGTAAVRSGTWGTWKGMWMCGPSLDGSTVGFFGFGRIGIEVAKRLAPFGVSSFLYHIPNKKTAEFEERHNVSWVKFDELLYRSDFLIACSSLTPQTTEIFDRSAFQTMKTSSTFINISRGGVVHQEDLYDALRSGEIRCAGLDVTTPEPLPTNHPLLKLNNCVITPHIGSATYTTRMKMAELAAENLVKPLEGNEMPAEYLI